MKPSVLPGNGRPGAPITGFSPEPAGSSDSGRGARRRDGTSEDLAHHGALPPGVRRIEQRRVEAAGRTAQHRAPVAERVEACLAVVGPVTALPDPAEGQSGDEEVA